MIFIKSIPSTKENIQKQINTLAVFFLIFSFFTLPFSLALHNISYAFAIILALPSIRTSFQKTKKEPLTYVLLAFILLITITATYSLSPWSGALGDNFKKYLKIGLAALLLPLLTQEKTRKYCMQGFFIGMVFILLSTYLSIWFHLPWSSNKNLGWGGDYTVFGNYITQNIMMSFFTLLCIHQLSKEKSFFTNFLLIIAIISSAISTLYLSSGRTGYLTLFLGIAAYIVFRLPTKLSIISLSLVFIVGLFSFNTSKVLQTRYQQAKEETTLIFKQANTGETPALTSIGARWYMWMKSIELIQEKPLTGWGLGSHGVKWCEKAPEPEWCAVGDTTPHNQFIFFFTEMGVLGFFWFLTLLATLIWAAWSNKIYRPLFMGFIAIFIGDSLVNASLWNAREYNFFIIMLCWLYCSAKFSSKTIIPTNAKS